MGVEIEEVVTLQQLIGELGEAQTIAGFAVESALHRVLGHHVIDSDMLAHLAGEVKEGVVFHPVVVVDQLGSVRRIALKVEETTQLLFDALHIVAQRGLVQQVALLALARGVANHASGTADQSQRFMSAALEMSQHHHAAQVAYMQAVGGGVNAYVCSGGLLGKLFLSAWHDLVEHASPFKFFYKVHRIIGFYNS